MIAKARRHHDETTMRRCGRILAAVLAIEGMSVTHEKVTLFIHTGPRASDQHQVPDGCAGSGRSARRDTARREAGGRVPRQFMPCLFTLTH